ncbi:hypothetical protein NDU88_000510, partial [Pleurodeles waltl]
PQGNEGQVDHNSPHPKRRPSNEGSLPLTLCTTPVGGSITDFIHEWRSITKDKW